MRWAESILPVFKCKVIIYLLSKWIKAKKFKKNTSTLDTKFREESNSLKGKLDPNPMYLITTAIFSARLLHCNPHRWTTTATINAIFTAVWIAHQLDNFSILLLQQSKWLIVNTNIPTNNQPVKMVPLMILFLKLWLKV